MGRSYIHDHPTLVCDGDSPADVRPKERSADRIKPEAERNLNETKRRRKTKKHDKASTDKKLKNNIKLVQQLGYQSDHVLEAVSRIQESGNDITYDSLIDMTFHVQDAEDLASIRNNPFDSYSTGGATAMLDETVDAPEEECNQSGGESDGGLTINSEDIIHRAVEKRKLELREAIDALTFQCKVCHNAKATILLLPCAHLVSCDDCLMDVKRCPVARCNKVVRGTKEVYFV